VEPASVLQHAGQQQLVLTGSGFTNLTHAWLGEDSLETVFQDRNTLVALVPAERVAVAGVADVEVRSFLQTVRSGPVPFTVRPTPGSTSWYFSWGRNINNWNARLQVFNPTAHEAHVTLRFMGTSTSVSGALDVAPWRHREIDTATSSLGMGPGTTFGLEVTADVPVIASQLEWAGADKRAAGTLGSRVLSTDWILGAGHAYMMSTYRIAALNPGDQPAHVDLTRYRDNGSVVTTAGLDVLSERAATNLQTTGTWGPIWTAVTANRPVLVGHDHGATSPASNRDHMCHGVTQPSATWFLPFGDTEGDVLSKPRLTNPSATEAAHVVVEYHVNGQQPLTDNHVVDPLGTTTLATEQDSVVGRGRAFWVKVTSDVPIVATDVESSSSSKDGAYRVMPTGPATDLVLVGGWTRDGWSTFLRLANPGTLDAVVTWTLHAETFSTTGDPLLLPAGTCVEQSLSQSPFSYSGSEAFSLMVSSSEPILGSVSLGGADGAYVGMEAATP
jgi:hypothetical protein